MPLSAEFSQCDVRLIQVKITIHPLFNFYHLIERLCSKQPTYCFHIMVWSSTWTFHSHVKVNTVSFQQNSSDLHLTYPPFLFYLPLVNMQLWPCLFYDPNIKGSTLLFLFKSFINLTKIRVINYCFSDIIIMFVCLHNLVRRHCL